MDEKRVTLRLLLSNPEQKKVWEIIAAIPRGRRTQALCEKILEQEKREELRDIVYSALNQALDEHDGVHPISPEKTKKSEAGEIRNDILGFLSALQEEGES